MPEIPRDPRQLARDILSGKIRIEDIARERQRQAGLSGPANAPARLPSQIPLPKPPSLSPVLPRPQTQRPTMPARPVRQIPPPPRPPVRQAPRTMPAQPKREERSPLVIPAMQAQAYAQSSDAPSITKISTPATRSPLSIKDLIRTKAGMRQGILLAEILGKPVAFREF